VLIHTYCLSNLASGPSRTQNGGAPRSQRVFICRGIEASGCVRLPRPMCPFSRFVHLFGPARTNVSYPFALMMSSVRLQIDPKFSTPTMVLPRASRHRADRARANRQIACLHFSHHHDCRVVTVPIRDGKDKNTSILRGQNWVNELPAGHPTRFNNAMGMREHVFRGLVRELRETPERNEGTPMPHPTKARVSPKLPDNLELSFELRTRRCQ
jgi:hypothetical protein